MQQKVFVIEAIGEEPCKAYSGLDALIKDATSKYGPMDQDSKERARGVIENGRVLGKHGTLFRCFDKEGTKTSFIVFEATVQSK